MGRFLYLFTALLSSFLLVSSFHLSKEDKELKELRQFKCLNGRKIQSAWKCDGDDDCGDNSDETNSDCTPRPCDPGTEFQCNNKMCIKKDLICDGEPDCPDSSDETLPECSAKGCAIDMFECTIGHCIPLDWYCDGKEDCKNGLDEKCNRTCDAKQHTCNEDGSCIERSWVCDGEADCPQGSDEAGCEIKEQNCPTGDFKCDDGRCITQKWVCDGVADCRDNSDERRCNETIPSFCKENEFQCLDKSCIHNSHVCDGDIDCIGGGDEAPAICSHNKCPTGMFKCNNGACIAGDLKCNGIADCRDESDEHECEYYIHTCMAEEIDCGTGHCVAADKACDGIKDCPNGKDEPLECGVNECLHNNGGCDQICIDTTLGHRCECSPGYKLSGNSSCVDIDECEIFGACSQICINQKGSYSCQCYEGYTREPKDHRRCKATTGGAQILYSRRHDIRSTTLDGHLTKLVVKNTSLSVALDYDYKSNAIFWSDSNKIYKAHIEGGQVRIPVVTADTKIIDNLAVDWIYDHIYWTDRDKSCIEVSNFEGNVRKVLISTDLDQPRAIAVDPKEGLMFWSDWGQTGKIEKADLDGSERNTIVSYEVKWPNGITLDLMQKKLYWVDAKLSAIYSINYDGSSRRKIGESSSELFHPYSLSLFEDTIYWTDWDKHNIYKADKYDGSNITAIAKQYTLQNPMVIHVHHPYLQPISENLCAEAKCSHFCFPKQNRKVICDCPDGLHLLPDKKMCAAQVLVPDIKPVTPEIPKTPPPIIIDFPENPDVDYALMTILILSGISVVLVVLAFLSLVLYRLYTNGNIKIMNFDNPMYKKAAGKDPYSYNIEAQMSYPSTPGSEEAHQPLTSSLAMASTLYQ